MLNNAPKLAHKGKVARQEMSVMRGKDSISPGGMDQRCRDPRINIRERGSVKPLRKSVTHGVSGPGFLSRSQNPAAPDPIAVQRSQQLKKRPLESSFP
jgi:hypothetical protein